MDDNKLYITKEELFKDIEPKKDRNRIVDALLTLYLIPFLLVGCILILLALVPLFAIYAIAYPFTNNRKNKK